jgi:hypothetical protein
MDEDTESVKITLTFSVISAVVTIGTYIFTSKWKCCYNGEKSLLDVILARFKCSKKNETAGSYSTESQSKPDEDKRSEPVDDTPHQRDKPPLCNSGSFVNFVVVLHIFSKVVMMIANIIYLSVTKFPMDDSELDPKQKRGMNLSYFITFIGSIYEIVYIFFVPIYVCFFSKCWNLERAKFLSYLRYGDLQFALMVAPFVSVHLHYLGGVYWVFIFVRIFFYCATFVAVVIAGINFILGVCCFKLVEIACCSNNEAVEIKDFKHLFKDVGIQLVSLMLKLQAGSSALATYFKIGIIQDDPVQYAYLAFTLLICLNVAAGLFYNSILLRWRVMKEENKTDGSAGSKTLEFLAIKTPSSHVAFVLNICISGGLIALNSYILHVHTS